MKLKKFLAFFLAAAAISLTCGLSITANAYTADKSLQTYRSRFQDGEAQLDYCYYSPVKSGNDDTKYPLVIWLHGNKSGDYPRHQLENSEIGYWASSGAQSYFSGGGAFIFLPRDQTGTRFAWEGKTAELKNTIDYFISLNKKNVDMSKIYIGGYSMGGNGAMAQIEAYPDFYAAAYLMSPMYIPSLNDFEVIKHIPIWLFTCKKDIHAPMNPALLITEWEALCSVTEVPEKIRWTQFDAVYRPDGSIVENERHNTWNSVVHDLFTDKNEPLDGLHTVDGNGSSIEIKYPDGFLHWLNSMQKTEQPPKPNKFAEFFRKITEFIMKIISLLTIHK